MPKLVLYALKTDEVQSALEELSSNLDSLSMMDVELNWMGKDEILDVIIDKEIECAFVIPDFSGPIFDGLKERDVRIWSHHFLQNCLHRNQQLPKEPKILWSMAFKNLVVSFTGMDKTKKQELADKIVMMGGMVSPNFYRENDMLIAESLDTSSKKYIAAINWKKEICRPEMVDNLWNMASNYPYIMEEKFLETQKVPVFKGCVICTSGLNPQERTSVGQLVESYGGKYMVEMVRDKCTHLIVAAPQGEKYKFATKWGIKIVTTSWLRRCIESGLRFSEKKYHPELEHAKKTNPLNQSHSSNRILQK